MLNVSVAGWHSWFFGAEGSIFMAGGRGKRLFPVVSIGSTNRNVILSLIRDTGVGKPTIRKAKSPKQKDLYQWRCFAAAAISYLRQILPFSLLKRGVIEQVLKWCEELERNPRLGYLPEWRDEVLEASKALNARGAKRTKGRRLLPYPKEAVQEIESVICPDLYEPFGNLEILPDLSYGYCLCCGKPLPSGRNRWTCSRECAYVVRRRRGKPCRVIHQSLCPRLAALVDGEGHVGLARSGKTIHARIDIGNTDETIIRMLRRSLESAALPSDGQRRRRIPFLGIGGSRATERKDFWNRFPLICESRTFKPNWHFLFSAASSSRKIE
jgi:predicted nucleic acid-binding Zn ribbon protein